MAFYPESELHNPILKISDDGDTNSNDKRTIIESIIKPFKYTVDDCKEMKKIFLQEMLRGLSSDESERKKSCLLMENTFMTKLPSGKEKGHFLSLDLGSTNFRVILSRLKGSDVANGDYDDEFVIKYYDVPHDLRVGQSAVPLFNFLAKCIKDFVDDKMSLEEKKNKIPLAFSFSYPMVQKSVDSGFLVTWTKSYDLPDAVGRDAVGLLRQAIANQPGLHVDVLAILNDSTGTLLKGAYLEKDCYIGMIFGSGFNVCYVERVDQIDKLSNQDKQMMSGASRVAIDIECGAFGDNGCIDRFKNQIDNQLDEESMFQRSFSFEKMLAGNFLGDVARRIIIQLVQHHVLFDGLITSSLMTKDSIKAADLVDIERIGVDKVREIFAKLGYDNLTDDDVKIIRFVGKIVAIRAAVLTSTLLSALIDRIGEKRIVVAIDGSLYSHHPFLHQIMMEVITVLSPAVTVKIINAKDGSGMGAGLAAAVLAN